MQSTLFMALVCVHIVCSYKPQAIQADWKSRCDSPAKQTDGRFMSAPIAADLSSAISISIGRKSIRVFEYDHMNQEMVFNSFLDVNVTSRDGILRRLTIFFSVSDFVK